MGIKPFLALFCVIVPVFLIGCSAYSFHNDNPQITSLTVNGSAGTVDPNDPSHRNYVIVYTGSTNTVACVANDPNHDPLTFTWTSAIASSTPGSNPNVATFTPSATGITDIVCMVSDGRGGIVQQQILVLAQASPIPTISLSATSSAVENNNSILVTATATDPLGSLGSPLTYYWSTTAGDGTITPSSGSNDSATFAASTPAPPATATITCTVVDKAGNSATAMINITILP